MRLMLERKELTALREIRSILVVPFALLGLLLATHAWAGAAPNVLVAGQDFDGDGTADVWGASTNSTRIDLIDPTTGTSNKSVGFTVIGRGWVGTGGGTWSLVGVGDVDGDGRADLIYTNGTLFKIVFMDGVAPGATGDGAGAAVAAVYLNANGWSLGAVGDLDNDGGVDLVLNPSGATGAMKVIRGITRAGAFSASYIGNAGGTYSAAAVADVDAAGGNVAVIQNGTGGSVRVTQTSSGTPGSSFFIPNGSGALAVFGAGQADGANGADVFLRGGGVNATKIVTVDGTSVLGSGFAADGAFPAEVLADTNGDGNVDLVGRDGGTNLRSALVSGTSVSGKVFSAINSGSTGIGGAGDTDQDDVTDIIVNNTTAYDLYVMDAGGVESSGSIDNSSATFAMGGAAVPAD